MDQALLEACEAGEAPPTLRFWESAVRFVVVGYANKRAEDVRLDGCRRDRAPVLRRTTGGGSVVQGPGCLNFCVVLRKDALGDPHAPVDRAIRALQTRHEQRLGEAFGEAIRMRGLSDLAVGDFKISGSALRFGRVHLLFHATLLLDFDIPSVDALLDLPRRQPDYRRQRSHAEFLRNLEKPAHRARRALRAAWDAREPLREPPYRRMRDIIARQYGSPEWRLQ